MIKTFTLMEIVISLLLISLAGGVLLQGGNSLLLSEREALSREAFNREVTLCKIVSLIGDVDIFMDIKSDGSSLYIKKYADYIPRGADRFLNEELTLSNFPMKDCSIHLCPAIMEDQYGF